MDVMQLTAWTFLARGRPQRGSYGPVPSPSDLAPARKSAKRAKLRYRRLPLLPILLLLLMSAAKAATRPRYGGTLRVEMLAAIRSLDPAEWPVTAVERAAKIRLASLILENLARLDESGAAKPWLAASWDHDLDFKNWSFRLQPGVKLHDGSPLTPSAAANAINATLSGMHAKASGELIWIQSEHSVPELPRQLARSKHSIFLRTADGRLLGTGPFRVAEWQPGRLARLTAHEEHRTGRPFLDAVEIEMGRPLRDQLVDLELGRADVIEVAPNQVRSLGQRDFPIWYSVAVELWALVFRRDSPGVQDARLREAMLLSIDRASAHAVLLHKQGEPSGGLLPQWLSGYAFLFPTVHNLARARSLLAGLAGRSLILSYNSGDTLERSIAERVAVNAREAGLLIKPIVEGQALGVADLRLLRVPIASVRGSDALAELANDLGLLPIGSVADSAESLFGAEQDLLKGSWVIPLFHLPVTFGLAQHVRRISAQPARTGDRTLSGWPLYEFWIRPNVPRGKP